MPLLREPRDYAILVRALAQSAMRPATVLFGDSRAKASQVTGATKICFGGAGIRDFGWLIRLVCGVASPRRVIVALGLNDARSPTQDPQHTAAELARLLADVPEVVIVQPWPLEVGKRYSERFDFDFLTDLSIELRRVADANEWSFVPAPTACITFDGAHFAGAEQMAYEATLQSQVTTTNGMSLTAAH